MTRAEAIEWLEIATPIRELSPKDYKRFMKAITMAIDSLEADEAYQLPSVIPQEPKTGHWNDIPKYKDIAWQCSECEHFTTMKHNYCPNCGVKMVDSQESEET